MLLAFEIRSRRYLINWKGFGSGRGLTDVPFLVTGANRKTQEYSVRIAGVSAKFRTWNFRNTSYSLLAAPIWVVHNREGSDCRIKNYRMENVWRI
jgi:hypothetical protein